MPVSVMMMNRRRTIGCGHGIEHRHTIGAGRRRWRGRGRVSPRHGKAKNGPAGPGAGRFPPPRACHRSRGLARARPVKYRCVSSPKAGKTGSAMHDHHAPPHSHSDHDHAHGHSHAPASFGRAFLIGIVLNSGFVVAEAAYGFFANSLALLADAGHNLSDVLGLVLAWAAAPLVNRQPTARHTYGLKRTSILASLGNAMLLLVATGAIILDAVR